MLSGVGDFQVADVNFLPDPCALPDAQKKRALNEKERLLYAPMAGVGGVVYDKDAVYIDLPANHVNQQQVCVFWFLFRGFSKRLTDFYKARAIIQT